MRNGSLRYARHKNIKTTWRCLAKIYRGEREKIYISKKTPRRKKVRDVIHQPLIYRRCTKSKRLYFRRPYGRNTITLNGSLFSLKYPFVCPMVSNSIVHICSTKGEGEEDEDGKKEADRFTGMSNITFWWAAIEK